MKRFRVMAAALCAAVLLCGFSVPAYAYADGGEGADYGDPTMTEETPAPEPEPPTTDERVAKLESENKLLREQVSAQADQAEFYEECIAEMAAIVYA